MVKPPAVTCGWGGDTTQQPSWKPTAPAGLSHRVLVALWWPAQGSFRPRGPNGLCPRERRCPASVDREPTLAHPARHHSPGKGVRAPAEPTSCALFAFNLGKQRILAGWQHLGGQCRSHFPAKSSLRVWRHVSPWAMLTRAPEGLWLCAGPGRGVLAQGIVALDPDHGGLLGPCLSREAAQR